MGKQSRREGRRNRHQRRRMGPGTTRTGLTLIVATSPVSIEDGNFLAHDLELVRAALLYADTVELISPVAQMVSGISALQSASPDGWLDLLSQLDDATLTHVGVEGGPTEFRDAIAKYRGLAGLPRARRREILGKHNSELQDIQRAFAQHLDTSDGPRQQLTAVLERAGAPELGEAVDSGALTMKWDIEGFDDPDAMVDQYAQQLTRMLASPDTHLLLDESMAGIARGLIDEGHVAPPDLTLLRAARSRVGAGLVSHLPAFPHANISTVLEARADLAGPLAAYRGGATRMASRLRSGPFDSAADGEIADMWRDCRWRSKTGRFRRLNSERFPAV